MLGTLIEFAAFTVVIHVVVPAVVMSLLLNLNPVGTDRFPRPIGSSR